MEKGYLLVSAMVVLSFAAAFFWFSVVSDFLKRTKRGSGANAQSGLDKSFLHRLLRNGVRAFHRPSQFLLRSKRIDQFLEISSALFLFKGFRTSPKALLSVLIAVFLILFAVGFLLVGSFAFGAALCVCVGMGFAFWQKHLLEKRRVELRDEIPEALQAMKACFAVGYSLPQTFSQVHAELKGPLKLEFKKVSDVFDSGGSVEQALNVMKEESREPELVFLAAALEIQHKTGSGMQQILNVTYESVRDELELKRSLKTQTAQAKLSARIVTVMPFCLIALFSLVSEGFLDPFFESFMGVVLLLIALLMQAAGIILVRRLLKVEVL